MWAVCSTTINKSIKINKTVAALKNNHGANITRYWPPSHCDTGGGQKVTAPPPYGRWARVPGGREEEQTYFLVGNN